MGPFLDIRIPRYTSNWFAVSAKECIASANIDGLILNIQPVDLAKVTIREEGKDEAEDYYLLGPIEFELDLYPLVVTIHSPFGQAIVGKKIDEDFTLEIQGKETKFTITAIEKISAE